MKRGCAAAAISLLVAGCSQSTPASGEVELYPGLQHAWQLRVRYHVEGRGNLHDPFDFSKFEYDASHWIGLDRDTGVLELADIDLHSCPESATEDFINGEIPARGAITLSTDKAVIALQVPDGTDAQGRLRWIDFELNGEYRLVRPAIPASAAPRDPGITCPK